jgi:hypothetical protein
MTVFIKLNRWPDRLAVRDRRRIRKLLGWADRVEFMESMGIQYCRILCLNLWRAPQINWDGRLVGCMCNMSHTFADYVLDERFQEEVNNERMRYARQMLMGDAPPREDIPCARCTYFDQISEHGLWYTPEEIGSES